MRSGAISLFHSWLDRGALGPVGRFSTRFLRRGDAPAPFLRFGIKIPNLQSNWQKRKTRPVAGSRMKRPYPSTRPRCSLAPGWIGRLRNQYRRNAEILKTLFLNSLAEISESY